MTQLGGHGAQVPQTTHAIPGAQPPRTTRAALPDEPPRTTPPAGRGRRLVGPLAALTGVAVAWSAVALLRPGDAGPTPCVFRTLTGLDCPFCGSTRAAACLAHGDLIGALDHNALFVVGLVPLAALAWLLWVSRAWHGTPPRMVSSRLLIALLALTGVWWAVRLAVPWLGSGTSL